MAFKKNSLETIQMFWVRPKGLREGLKLLGFGPLPSLAQKALAQEGLGSWCIANLKGWTKGFTHNFRWPNPFLSLTFFPTALGEKDLCLIPYYFYSLRSPQKFFFSFLSRKFFEKQSYKGIGRKSTFSCFSLPQSQTSSLAAREENPPKPFLKNQDKKKEGFLLEPRQPNNKKPLRPNRKQQTIQFYTISYLFFILGLPLAALFRSAGTALFDDFWEVSTSPVALAAYSYTLSMALFAAIFNGIFGLLLAWVLVRYHFWGRRILDSAVDLPFALPTSVAGLTLANLYSEKTILGKFLYDQGFVILFTPIAVGIAMIFVSFPFVVRTVKPVLENIEKELEEAAWSLGAYSFTTFRKIIFPPIKPALITGITLAFSRAVGEYGSIVVVSSNIPEKDYITSVLIFQNLEQYSHRSAAIIGTVMLFLSLILLFLINVFGFINQRR